MADSHEERVLGMLGKVDIDKVNKRTTWINDAIELLFDTQKQRGLTDWEEGFVDSIFNAMSRKSTISDKQFNTLNSIVKKYHPGEGFDE